MGPLPNLIYYASISTKEVRTIVEYKDYDRDEELPRIAAKCLRLLPAHHSRFSHTFNYRMFACIIDETFLYCTIADETLRRTQVMSFLEQVRHEFTSCVRARGLLVDHTRLEAHSLDMLVKPVFRRLVGPFVGIPKRTAEEAESRKYAEADADVEAGLSGIYQPAETAAYDNYSQAPPYIDGSPASGSPSRPLIGKSGSKKYKNKKHKEEKRVALENGDENQGKAFEKAHKMEIAKDTSSPNTQVQRLGGGSRSFRGQQVAQRKWRRRVKLVLLLEGIIGVILFGIWLGICRGFSCRK